MKRVIFSLLILAMSLPVFAQFTRANLQATGLTCALCSNAINKALRARPFVESVSADIKNSSFEIVFKSGMDVNIDEIRKAVEDAGFSIGALRLTGEFSNVKVNNDEHVRIGDKNFHFVGVNNQMLNGPVTILMAEKDFLTPKLFKKYSQSTHSRCYQTGKAADCCTGMAAGSRVYSVTIG